MKIINNSASFITLSALFLLVGALGDTAYARGSGRGHHGPPPEAYTACEGKSEGDTAEFESPHGDTVTGTCEQDRDGDRLVLRPDNPPPKAGRPGMSDD